MKHIATTFFRGLSVVLPVVLTAWLVVWLANGAESILREVFKLFLPDRYYLPGLGIALGVAVIYTAGILVKAIFVQAIWEWLERQLERIPLIKTIYAAISDFLGFFSSNMAERSSTVVSVDIGGGARLIGFVTSQIPAAFNELSSDLVAVYMPLSYQIGGYTALLPRERITVLEIGVEEAMRFVLTAGIQRKGSKARSD
jgi:uncharacterized membrane protein